MTHHSPLITHLILSCPSCAAQFNIDPNALGATGRAVRCGKCKHQWHAARPLITLPADDLTFPAQEKMPALSPSSQETMGIARNSIAGSVSSSRKTTFTKEAFTQEDVMAFLPSARSELAPKRNAVIAAVLLAGLLSVPIFMMSHTMVQAPSPLRTEEKKVEVKKEDREIVLEGTPTTLLKEELGQTVLSIEGALINKTTRTLPVPTLQAQALNARGKVIKEWIIPIGPREMDPGQRQPFSFSMPFPEQGVVDIAFRFL